MKMMSRGQREFIAFAQKSRVMTLRSAGSWGKGGLSEFLGTISTFFPFAESLLGSVASLHQLGDGFRRRLLTGFSAPEKLADLESTEVNNEIKDLMKEVIVPLGDVLPGTVVDAVHNILHCIDDSAVAVRGFLEKLSTAKDVVLNKLGERMRDGLEGLLEPILNRLVQVSNTWASMIQMFAPLREFDYETSEEDKTLTTEQEIEQAVDESLSPARRRTRALAVETFRERMSDPRDAAKMIYSIVDSALNIADDLSTHVGNLKNVGKEMKERLPVFLSKVAIFEKNYEKVLGSEKWVKTTISASASSRFAPIQSLTQNMYEIKGKMDLIEDATVSIDNVVVFGDGGALESKSSETETLTDSRKGSCPSGQDAQIKFTIESKIDSESGATVAKLTKAETKAPGKGYSEGCSLIFESELVGVSRYEVILRTESLVPPKSKLDSAVATPRELKTTVTFSIDLESFGTSGNAFSLKWQPTLAIAPTPKFRDLMPTLKFFGLEADLNGDIKNILASIMEYLAKNAIERITSPQQIKDAALNQFLPILLQKGQGWFKWLTQESEITRGPPQTFKDLGTDVSTHVNDKISCISDVFTRLERVLAEVKEGLAPVLSYLDKNGGGLQEALEEAEIDAKPIIEPIRKLKHSVSAIIEVVLYFKYSIEEAMESATSLVSATKDKGAVKLTIDESYDDFEEFTPRQMSTIMLKIRSLLDSASGIKGGVKDLADPSTWLTLLSSNFLAVKKWVTDGELVPKVEDKTLSQALADWKESEHNKETTVKLIGVFKYVVGQVTSVFSASVKTIRHLKLLVDRVLDFGRTLAAGGIARELTGSCDKGQSWRDSPTPAGCKRSFLADMGMTVAAIGQGVREIRNSLSIGYDLLVPQTETTELFKEKILSILDKIAIDPDSEEVDEGATQGYTVVAFDFLKSLDGVILCAANPQEVITAIKDIVSELTSVNFQTVHRALDKIKNLGTKIDKLIECFTSALKGLGITETPDLRSFKWATGSVPAGAKAMLGDSAEKALKAVFLARKKVREYIAVLPEIMDAAVSTWKLFNEIAHIWTGAAMTKSSNLKEMIDLVNADRLFQSASDAYSRIREVARILGVESATLQQAIKWIQKAIKIAQVILHTVHASLMGNDVVVNENHHHRVSEFSTTQVDQAGLQLHHRTLQRMNLSYVPVAPRALHCQHGSAPYSGNLLLSHITDLSIFNLGLTFNFQGVDVLVTVRLYSNFLVGVQYGICEFGHDDHDDHVLHDEKHEHDEHDEHVSKYISISPYFDMSMMIYAKVRVSLLGAVKVQIELDLLVAGIFVPLTLDVHPGLKAACMHSKPFLRAGAGKIKAKALMISLSKEWSGINHRLSGPCRCSDDQFVTCKETKENLGFGSDVTNPVIRPKYIQDLTPDIEDCTHCTEEGGCPLGARRMTVLAGYLEDLKLRNAVKQLRKIEFSVVGVESNVKVSKIMSIVVCRETVDVFQDSTKALEKQKYESIMGISYYSEPLKKLDVQWFKLVKELGDKWSKTNAVKYIPKENYETNRISAEIQRLASSVRVDFDQQAGESRPQYHAINDLQAYIPASQAIQLKVEGEKISFSVSKGVGLVRDPPTGPDEEDPEPVKFWRTGKCFECYWIADAKRYWQIQSNIPKNKRKKGKISCPMVEERELLYKEKETMDSSNNAAHMRMLIDGLNFCDLQAKEVSSIWALTEDKRIVICDEHLVADELSNEKGRVKGTMFISESTHTKFQSRKSKKSNDLQGMVKMIGYTISAIKWKDSGGGLLTRQSSVPSIVSHHHQQHQSSDHSTNHSTDYNTDHHRHHEDVNPRFAAIAQRVSGASKEQTIGGFERAIAHKQEDEIRDIKHTFDKCVLHVDFPQQRERYMAAVRELYDDYTARIESTHKRHTSCQLPAPIIPSAEEGVFNTDNLFQTYHQLTSESHDFISKSSRTPKLTHMDAMYFSRGFTVRKSLSLSESFSVSRDKLSLLRAQHEAQTEITATNTCFLFDYRTGAFDTSTAQKADIELQRVTYLRINKASKNTQAKVLDRVNDIIKAAVHKWKKDEKTDEHPRAGSWETFHWKSDYGGLFVCDESMHRTEGLIMGISFVLCRWAKGYKATCRLYMTRNANYILTVQSTTVKFDEDKDFQCEYDLDKGSDMGEESILEKYRYLAAKEASRWFFAAQSERKNIVTAKHCGDAPNGVVS